MMDRWLLTLLASMLGKLANMIACREFKFHYRLFLLVPIIVVVNGELVKVMFYIHFAGFLTMHTMLEWEE